MSLTPFLSAEPIIQVHAAAAVLAVALGPVAIYRRRQDRLHKATGYVWVSAMALVALSSFGITGFGLIGPLSPIHLLSVLALWSLWTGMRQILAGQVAAHAATMRSLYWNGLLVAGAFNFLPGRVVNRMIFDTQRELGWIVLALVLAVIALRALRLRQRRGARAIPRAMSA